MSIPEGLPDADQGRLSPVVALPLTVSNMPRLPLPTRIALLETICLGNAELPRSQPIYAPRLPPNMAATVFSRSL